MAVTSSTGYDPRAAARIAAFPEVAQSRSWVGIAVFVERSGQRTLTSQDLETDGTLDNEYFQQDRFTATSGRAADPKRSDEVVVNEFAAKRFDLRAGERVTLDTYSTDQLEVSDPAKRGPPKARTAATITGVGLFPDEVLQDDGDRAARLLLTPAFSKASTRWFSYGVQTLVLHGGDRDVEAMKRNIATIDPPGTVQIRATSVDAFHARQAVRPLAIALGIFGLIIGIAGLVLVGQASARMIRSDQDDGSVLRAMGMRPSSVAQLALLGPMLSIVGGMALAAVVALLASPLMPVGPLRRVEARPGFDLDVTVVVLGSIAALLVLLGVSAIVARPVRVRRRRARTSRRSVAEVAADAGLRSPAVAGLQFASETTPGSSARAVIAGGTVAVAALAAALTFGVSLEGLVHAHRLYGWNGDAAILAGNGFGNIPLDQAHAILDADQNIDAWSGAYFGFGGIGNQQDIPMLGMEPSSAIAPPFVEGRMPRNDQEIALGVETAAQLHVHAGEVVQFAGAGPPRRLSVVGLATFPTIGQAHAAHPSLGVGALVVSQLVPGFDHNITGQLQPGVGPHVVFVRFRPGVNASTEIEHLKVTTRPLAGFAGLDVLTVQRPAEIVNSSNLGTAPTVLAVALAAGAVLSLGLALETSVRRHRRDLAVLKTLGFTRGQLAATTAWHATSVTVVALVIGVPVGIAAGRIFWDVFAHQLEVVARPVVPVVEIALLVGGAVLVANLVAAVPARAARRVSAASLLRAE
jgi:hypothetical protein